MGRRLELDECLCGLIGITDPIDGDRHVYFQPPESVNMKYPAIKYNLKGYEKNHANNGIYMVKPSYEVTLIDHDPDSQYFDKILQLPCCSFDRHYAANNLNHFVFTLFY